MGSPYGNDPPSRRFGEAGPPHRSDEAGPPTHDSGEAGPTPDRDRADAARPEADQSASPAQQRFLTCRWRKPAENGVPDHCGHRDVLPMAGATGFVPDAWCPDCEYFKAKRTPRKREENDRDRDWRW